MPCQEVEVTGQRIAESSRPPRTGHSPSREACLAINYWRLATRGKVERPATWPDQSRAAGRQSKPHRGRWGGNASSGGRSDEGGGRRGGSVFGCRCQPEGLRSQVGAASLTARISPCIRSAWASIMRQRSAACSHRRRTRRTSAGGGERSPWHSPTVPCPNERTTSRWSATGPHERTSKLGW